MSVALFVQARIEERIVATVTDRRYRSEEILEVSGLSKAALWLRPMSFAFNPALRARPVEQGYCHTLANHLNFADAKLVEVRGFEPLAFSLRTRRSTN
jgi:hypothetical protein